MRAFRSCVLCVLSPVPPIHLAPCSCVSGCECAPVLVDAHHTERVTQVYLVQLVVSQHKECELEVKVGVGEGRVG